MKDISRRDFLRMAGAGSLALGAAAAGCSPKGGRTEGTATGGDEAGMTYRDAGNGEMVSLLGYGCMRWPTTKDGEGNDILDQEKINELIDAALEGGVNYFDTSPHYGRGYSETCTGIALARHPRNTYYIATKLSNFGAGGYLNRADSLKMYHDSFDLMQTDYFDYYLLHGIGMGGYEAFDARYISNGVIDYLLAEREAGRIRRLGFSFHGTRDCFDRFMALHEKYHWDFVQIQMNYVDWRHAEGNERFSNTNAEYLYSELDRREIPITVMEPLRGSRLANPPANVVRKLKERDPDASAASWAFRFTGSFPRVLTVLSGMTYMEHLQENLRTFSGLKPMSEGELGFMEELAGLIVNYPEVNCNDCKYCMPCPYGIDIPGIFKHYNECISSDMVVQSREQAGYRKLRRAWLTSYNEAIPTLRQADHCIGCGQCMPHCPQSIRIPNELRRIDRYIEALKQDTL